MMNFSPQVSVIIPAHGICEYLDEALASVAMQTFTDFELIVVDERASCDLVPRVKSFVSNATIIESKGIGAAAARQTGTEVAQGNWLAFLDADDVWSARKLEKQLELAAASEDVRVVGCYFYEFSGRAITCRRPRSLSFSMDNPLRAVLLHDIIIPSTALCRKDAVDAIGGWPDERQFEDTIFFGRLASKYKFAMVGEPLAYYRSHLNNRSKTHKSGRYEAYIGVVDSIKKINPNIDPKIVRDFNAHAHFLVSHWHRTSGRRMEAIRAAGRAVIAGPKVYLHWFALLRNLLPKSVDRFVYTRFSHLGATSLSPGASKHDGGMR